MSTSNNGNLFDFTNTPVASDYKGRYVKVIDDVFSPSECASLLALAESDQQWQTAAILTRRGDIIDTNYRNSDRILRFDHATAEMIFQRLLPYIPELVEIKPGGEWQEIVGYGQLKRTWKLLGLNERLSFLRYGPGHFFKPHCDGQIELPDGRKSRVTLQIYLNNEGLSGGATRFLGRGNSYLDIEPKVGRVLIFQQKAMVHSGEPVVEGLKYAMRSDFMFEEVL